MTGADPAEGRARTVGALGERQFIARVRRRLPPPPPDVLVGIGDDTAAIAWPGGTLLVTTDIQLEDVHFRRATTGFRDLGARALAVNLSDIAAMGGEPRFAVLALALPADLALADVDELYAGLEEMAGRYGVTLVGGDTCRAPERLTLTITLVGSVGGTPLLRSGARPGDAIVVTGTLGAAAAGLAALEHGAVAVAPELAARLQAAHRRPTPRIAEGRLIRTAGGATAMIDLSDGLATDLDHIATESGVGADVRLAAVPVDEAAAELAAKRGVDPLAWAVSGGEDYELLFTADPVAAAGLARRVPAETGTRVTRIGEIRPAGAGVRFVDAAGAAVPVAPGFEHFRR